MMKTLPIETKKGLFSESITFMRLGLVKGRNLLKSLGFIQCENPLYYKKNSEYWYYNKLSKVWILENV